MYSLNFAISVLENFLPVSFSQGQVPQEVLTLSRQIADCLAELECGGDWLSQLRAKLIRQRLSAIEQKLGVLIFSAGGAK